MPKLLGPMGTALAAWRTDPVAALLVAPTGPSRRGSHRLATLDRCRKQWKLRYRDNWVLAIDKPFRMRGTLWHLCCAYYETSRRPEAERPEWFNAKDLYTTLREVGAGYEAMVEHLYREAFPRYVAHANAQYELNGLIPLAVEEEVAVRVGEIDPGGPDPTLDHEVVTCTPDLILTNAARTYGLVDDYKTKARSYRKDGRLSAWRPKNEFTPNWQVLTNLHLVRAKYAPLNITSFMINRALVVPPYDFDRNAAVPPLAAYLSTPRKIREFVRRERELNQLLDEVGDDPRALAARGIVLENYDACWASKYGPCDYLDICTAPDEDARQRVIHANFVQRIITKEIEEDDDTDAAA